MLGNSQETFNPISWDSGFYRLPWCSRPAVTYRRNHKGTTQLVWQKVSSHVIYFMVTEGSFAISTLTLLHLIEPYEFDRTSTASQDCRSLTWQDEFSFKGIPRFRRTEILPPLSVGALKTCPPLKSVHQNLPPLDTLLVCGPVGSLIPDPLCSLQIVLDFIHPLHPWQYRWIFISCRSQLEASILIIFLA